MLWSTPKCPVDEEDKLWLEGSMAWLLEEFGRDAFGAVTVILPTDDFFPDEYYGEKEDVWPLVQRVCAYMNVDPEAIELKFFADRRGELVRSINCLEGSFDGASGLYHKRRNKFVVSLDSSQLTDPMCVVATVAHELGHVRLLGEERIDDDCEDHEPLTDLLTVFFGLGVFTANSAFSFQQWTDTNSQGWRTERKGYLTEEMFGYALALFALMRGEHNPAWPRYLEGSINTYFKNSQKYLAKTGDAGRLRELVLAQAAESA